MFPRLTVNFRDFLLARLADASTVRERRQMSLNADAALNDSGAIVTFATRLRQTVGRLRCGRLTSGPTDERYPLSGNEPLDLGHRMRCQLLRDLGRDALRHLRVKGSAEITQYFRWRDDDELLETIGVGMAIKHFRKLMGKPLLCK